MVWTDYSKDNMNLNYIKLNGNNLNVHEQRNDKYWYSYYNKIQYSDENEWTKAS